MQVRVLNLSGMKTYGSGIYCSDTLPNWGVQKRATRQPEMIFLVNANSVVRRTLTLPHATVVLCCVLQILDCACNTYYYMV